MNVSIPPQINPRLFRRVMGRFASGVTVIAADDDGEARGMTASAFMSGSLEPPLCVVSVAKRARMHALLQRSRSIGISILAEGQEALSEQFAGRPIPGLHPAFIRFGAAPLLADASARIAAEIQARHDCGDHTLIVAHILHMDCDDRPPLLYHAGRYAELAEHRGDQDAPVPAFW